MKSNSKTDEMVKNLLQWSRNGFKQGIGKKEKKSTRLVTP